MTIAQGQSIARSPVHRRARVAGATSAMGRTTAMGLAQHGFEVVVQPQDAELRLQTVHDREAVGGFACFGPSDTLDAGTDDSMRAWAVEITGATIPVDGGRRAI